MVPERRGNRPQWHYQAEYPPWASQVFLTADDPNYEDPLAIAEEISSFITRPVEKISDREQAIQLAMATTSKPEDAVIIAGKGADCYQIVNGVKEEYPGDATIAERYL